MAAELRARAGAEAQRAPVAQSYTMMDCEGSKQAFGAAAVKDRSRPCLDSQSPLSKAPGQALLPITTGQRTHTPAE